MKKLYRSRRTKLLGGVAAGFAEYFNTDVTVMRLLFALVAITIPSSFLAYILAWIIIPEDTVGASSSPKATPAPQIGESSPGAGGTVGSVPTANEILGGPNPAAPEPRNQTAPAHPVEPQRNRQLFGYVLIAVGTIVLAKRFVPSFLWRLPGHLIGQAWPVLIILVGAALIIGAVRGR
ncbi:MAG: PspC domain-containing protein [Bacillota bacterium]